MRFTTRAPPAAELRAVARAVVREPRDPPPPDPSL